MRRLLFFLVISSVLVTAYVLVAQTQNGEFGFPLDDAWIHQVYARNLGTRGEFAFFSGQPSSGSTSPLWALILGIGYGLRIDFRVWTISLGILLLAISAYLSLKISRRLGASQVSANWFVPLFVILEWHLSWATVSGMEIPLFVCLELWLVLLFLSEANPTLIGISAGALTLTRPEGVVLGLIVGIGIALRSVSEPSSGVRRSAEQSVRRVQGRRGVSGLPFFLAAFALPLVPYLSFNLWSSGALLPNTYYAKSAEYADLISRSIFPVRWLGLFRQPFLGAQILLLPGVVWITWRLIKERRWDDLLPVTWILVLPALYAWRLPVDYQFGRYEMPIIPLIGIYGILGTESLFRRIYPRVIRRALAVAVAVLLLAFAALGSNQYARSVAIINCEMVASARWTAENIPPGVLIAAHDIGAQGYFDSHPLLDLAGLVSPEVIPFIRDQTRLNEWMTARGAAYAIFFPTWYPELDGDPHFSSVHSQNCAVTHEEGELDLKVYKITASTQ